MYQLANSMPPKASDIRLQNQEWSALVRALRRHQKIFLMILGGFVGATFIVTLLIPKTYTTTVEIIAGSAASAQNASNELTNLPVLNALQLQPGIQSAQTYSELLMQDEVAQKVINRLHLHTSPQALLANVKVKPVTDTSILHVLVTWNSPQASAQIANAFVQAFVDHERDLVASSADAALRFTAQQLPPARRRMHRAQEALAQFEAAHQIADMNIETQNMLARMDNLRSHIANAEVDLRQNQALLGNDSEQLSALTPTSSAGGSITPNPILANLQSQLSAVEIQLQTAREQYTDRHPLVIHLRAQQEKLRLEIAKTPPTIVASVMTQANPVYTSLMQQAANSRAAISSDFAQLNKLHGQLAALQPALRRLPHQTNRLSELHSDATAAADLYTILQKRYNDALLSKSTALSDVTILSRANADNALAKPHLLTNLLIACVVGLALAFSGVFLLEFFDTTIKDEHDIEQLALPLLASIPRFENGGQLSLPSLHSLTIESFLQLVTALRYSSDQALRTVTFTSPCPGDGKSTIAMNTAIALAEVTPRILLIDADLRRPSLHKKFEIANTHGLSDVIVGSANLSASIQKTRYPGLDILTSGTPTPAPYPLLQSERFDLLLAEALKTYRTIIIDTPALAPVVDSAVICKKSQASVMVVAAGATDLRTTHIALERLHTIGINNILGIVVNRAVPQLKSLGGYSFESLPEAEKMLR